MEPIENPKDIFSFKLGERANTILNNYIRTLLEEADNYNKNNNYLFIKYIFELLDELNKY